MLNMNGLNKDSYLGHGVFVLDLNRYEVEKAIIQHKEMLASIDENGKISYETTKIFIKRRCGIIDIIPSKQLYPTAKEAMVALYPHLKEKTAQCRAWFHHHILAFYNSKQKDEIDRNWNTVKLVVHELRYLKQRLKHCYRITGIEEVKNVIDITDEAVLSVKSQLPDHAYMELEAVYAGKSI